MPQTRYELLATIGIGATSRVDKAHDTLIDRTVALKTIGNGFGSSELQKQFLREAQILGRLSHPNIISIYDLGTNDDGSAYLVMEYVPGKTLESVIAEKRAIPLARAGLWAGDLASALNRAHRAGVIHGDVKPANIFVTDDGQIKLGDFGIARFATQVSGTGRLVGTPAYLSPEQINGGAQDHRSDIFSLGIVLYQMVTGVRPFDGTSVAAVCAQIVALEPFPPSHHNPALPKEFDRIIMRCLAKDPNARYASGESLAASLYPFARSRPLPAPNRFDFSWLKRPLRPRDAWVCAGSVAAALLLIPLVYGWNRARSHAVAENGGVEAPLAAGSATAASRTMPVLDSAPAVPASSQKTPRPITRQHSTSAGVAAPPPGIAMPRENRETAGAPKTASHLENEGSAHVAPPSRDKTSLPASRAATRAAAAPASLGIEITSAIEGETLAIFADQQLVATSPLSITRPGESLRLERPLLAGPHEFRIALYRPDKSLHLERQGLAELQTAAPNLLSVHVLRHSKMLVKHDAELQILWPAVSAPDVPTPKAAKPPAPSASPQLRSVATSVAASTSRQP